MNRDAAGAAIRNVLMRWVKKRYRKSKQGINIGYICQPGLKLQIDPVKRIPNGAEGSPPGS